MDQDTALAFEEFIEKKWQDALNIAATEPTPWRGDGEKGAKAAHAPERAGGEGQGTLKLTGAVNVIEQGGGLQTRLPPMGPLL